MKTHKKTEIILREDSTIYAELDYIDCLQLKLDIIKGKIKEKLFFRNQYGGRDEIDEFGCCRHYQDFKVVSDMLRNVVKAQIEKRSEREYE